MLNGILGEEYSIHWQAAEQGVEIMVADRSHGSNSIYMTSIAASQCSLILLGQRITMKLEEERLLNSFEVHHT